MESSKVQKVIAPANEAIVKCPKCGADVPLTAALAAPMIEAVKAEAEVDKAAALESMRAELGHKALVQAQTIVERQMDEAMAATRRAQADAAAADAANLKACRDLEDMQCKLTAAQAAQADALRKERELADRERELALTVERGITDGVDRARQQARAEADEAARLKRVELESTIASMQVKLAEAQQKAEQGSQQMQGEVQELDLEQQLRARFSFDAIVEVGKGVNGADITQLVTAPSGARCGVLLFESKRTKNWSPGWLPKLREDGRAAQADLLVLVTQAMPKDVDGFDCTDNVWVVQPRLAIALTVALREGLLRVHATKQAQEGMATKAEEVYSYVTGPQFKRRVEAIVESYTTMQEDLTAEQKAVQRQWAKRAAQIERVLTSTSGMFGDLQGIAGRALPAPAGLDLPQ